MEQHRYYDKILIDESANNPPYLTKRGAFIILSIVSISCLAVWSQALQHNEYAAFFTGIAATACFIMACFYAKNILIWRAIQTKHIECSLRMDKDKLFPGASFAVHLKMRNTLPLVLNIAAIRWDYTHNLDISSSSEGFEVLPNTEPELTFAGAAAAIGHGSVFGTALVLSDIAGLFRMEIHIELYQKLSVFPKRPAHFGLARQNDAFLKWRQEKVKSACHDGDPENIRPWQHTDSMRRILWRKYARHQDLQAIDRSTHQEPSLFCLIDSGTYMRLTRPDKSCNLAECVEYLANCIPLFETVTFIAYDDVCPSVIARQQSAQKAFERLEKWLLDVLQWRPPSPNDPNLMTIWNTEIIQLYRDYKLYKGVDFSKKTGKSVTIDLGGLVQWAAADRASRALAQDDVNGASQIMSSPYENLLTSLVREHCRNPQSKLMPETPVPDISHVMPWIQKGIRSGNYNTYIWFSDFANPVDESAIRSISKSLREMDMAALAVFMPMPRHALNFNIRRGDLLRNLNRSKIGKAFDIVDVPQGRAKTSTAGVLRKQ